MALVRGRRALRVPEPSVPAAGTASECGYYDSRKAAAAKIRANSNATACDKPTCGPMHEQLTSRGKPALLRWDETSCCRLALSSLGRCLDGFSRRANPWCPRAGKTHLPGATRLPDSTTIRNPGFAATVVSVA